LGNGLATPHGADASGLRVLLDEPPVGRDRLVVASGLLKALSDHKRSDRTRRIQMLAASRNNYSTVTLTCREECGRVAQYEVAVAGFLDQTCL
jgi:hypothetical protein